MKGSSNSRGVSENGNEEIDWELRPGGMLVQKRDDGVGASGPMIKIKVSHGSYQHDISVPAQATFGDLLFNFFPLLGLFWISLFFFS